MNGALLCISSLRRPFFGPIRLDDFVGSLVAPSELANPEFAPVLASRRSQNIFHMNLSMQRFAQSA
jgi:hypothetical protein